MARLPKDVTEAVDLLGLPQQATVLAVGPAGGFVEAMADAVGSKGRVVVVHPPPEIEVPAHAEIVDGLPDGLTAGVVVVWLGPVTPHGIREYLPVVAADGALWIVFPKTPKGGPQTFNEAEVKRSLLVAGWKDVRKTALAVDAYAIHLRRRGS